MGNVYNVSHIKAICKHRDITLAARDLIKWVTTEQKLQMHVRFTLKGNYSNHLGHYTVK